MSQLKLKTETVALLLSHAVEVAEDQLAEEHGIVLEGLAFVDDTTLVLELAQDGVRVRTFKVTVEEVNLRPFADEVTVVESERRREAAEDAAAE